GCYRRAMSQFNDDVRRQLRSGLGTMWKMASSSLGTVREVVARSSEVGRKRVDLVLLRRERQQLLAKLGEALLPRIVRNELEVSDDITRIVDNLEDVSRRTQSATARVFDNAFGAPRSAGAEIFADDPDAEAFAEALEAQAEAEAELEEPTLAPELPTTKPKSKRSRRK